MHWLLEGLKQAENAQAGKKMDTSTKTTTDSKGGAQVALTQPAPTGLETPAEGPESASLNLPVPSNRWRPNWPALLILPLLGWVAYRIANWRGDLEPDDSDEFTKAMDDALPVILARQSTPRAVKRFVNKVRFIAMRQRQVWADDRTLWEKLWGVPQIHANPAATTVTEIPDGILVVLAALHYWQSDSLDSDRNLTRAQERWPSLKAYATADLEKYRGRYREYASGLRAS